MTVAVAIDRNGRRPSGIATMTSQGTAHGRFQRAIHRGNAREAEMAAREMGGLSVADALSLCELLEASPEMPPPELPLAARFGAALLSVRGMP